MTPYLQLSTVEYLAGRLFPSRVIFENGELRIRKNLRIYVNVLTVRFKRYIGNKMALFHMKSMFHYYCIGTLSGVGA